MSGRVRVGIGGWVFEPWRGTFYPDGLTQKRELEYASGKLTTIEVNGTFYGSQKPASFRKWHDETPEDFVFHFFINGAKERAPAAAMALWQRLGFNPENAAYAVTPLRPRRISHSMASNTASLSRASAAAGKAPASSSPRSLSASPVTMRSP